MISLVVTCAEACRRSFYDIDQPRHEPTRGWMGEHISGSSQVMAYCCTYILYPICTRPTPHATRIPPRWTLDRLLCKRCVVGKAQQVWPIKDVRGRISAAAFCRPWITSVGPCGMVVMLASIVCGERSAPDINVTKLARCNKLGNIYLLVV